MDPALRIMLQEGKGEDEVLALVRLRDSETVPPTIRLVTRAGNIATCRLKREDILETRAHEAVESLKAPRKLEIPGPEETLALPETSAEDSTWSEHHRPQSVPETGAGIVLGVVDFGCDFGHPDFRYADGSSRLLALWDQRGPRTDASPSPFLYGRVFYKEAIDHALGSNDPYEALDYHPADADPANEGAHGTHCLGIAAGNGLSGGPTGVAPDAELVFVHLASRGTEHLANLGDSVTLLEAVDFIFRVAGERPCVVSVSMGDRGGPHDGCTLLERGLDTMVAQRAGRAVCQSAGNYQHLPIHTSGQLRPGRSETVVWVTDEADVTPNELEVWYPGEDRLLVRVQAPDGERTRRVALGEQASLTVGGNEACKIYHRARDPNNRDNHIDCFLMPGTPAGAWEVELSGDDVVDGRYHCWVERDEACRRCQSLLHPDDAVHSSTTNSICNGFRTIAVGAYNSHSLRRELAFFSSRGPTRDGRSKPDCVAPGVRILAARSSPRDAEPGSPLHVRRSGTSMAAPYVAGTVALVFEATRYPLPIEETRKLILSTADFESAQAENGDGMGSGYLRIDKAVEAARLNTTEVKQRIDATALLPSDVRVSTQPATQPLAEKQPSDSGEAPMLLPADSAKPNLGAKTNEGIASEELSEESALIAESTSRNFVLISGGPGPFDDRDVEHDESWANYVTPPLLLTDTSDKAKAFKEVDEEVWWFVYKPAYERRWNEDKGSKHRDRQAAVKKVLDQNFASYADLIEGRAKQRGWNLRWLSKADDLWRKLRTFRRDSISRVWYWGHARNALWLSLRHTSDGTPIAPEVHEIIEISSIRTNAHLRSQFQGGDTSRIHGFIGCNTAAFAKAWANAFNVWSGGVHGKVDFGAIHKTGGRPRLVRDAKSSLFSPEGIETPSARDALPGIAEAVTAGGGKVEEPSGRFVALADKAVSTHRVEGLTPSALLAEVLAESDRTNSKLLGLEDHGIPLTKIFDALVFGQPEALQSYLGELFAVVARPKAALHADNVHSGDLLLRRRYGQDRAELAVLVNGKVLREDELVPEGLYRKEWGSGFYAQAVKGGHFPYASEDRIALRLSDKNGILLHDCLLMRVRNGYKPTQDEAIEMRQKGVLEGTQAGNEPGEVLELGALPAVTIVEAYKWLDATVTDRLDTVQLALNNVVIDKQSAPFIQNAFISRRDDIKHRITQFRNLLDAIKTYRTQKSPAAEKVGLMYQSLLFLVATTQLEANFVIISSYANAAGVPFGTINANFGTFGNLIRPLQEKVLKARSAKDVADVLAVANPLFEQISNLLANSIPIIQKNANLSDKLIKTIDIAMLAFNIYRIWKMPTVPLGSSPPPIFSVSGAGVATAGVVSTIDLAKLLASIKELIRIGALDPAIIGGLGLLGSPEGFPLPELEKPSVSQMASTKMYKTKPFTRGGVKFRLWGRGKDIQAFRSTEAGAQVYVIRDANGKVIYVGITERDSFTRLGEHLSKQPGEFLGKASRIEIRGAGLTEKQALALEQDLIQTHKPAFNKHLTPYSQKFQGTLPDPIDVKDANNIFISFEITFK